MWKIRRTGSYNPPLFLIYIFLFKQKQYKSNTNQKSSDLGGNNADDWDVNVGGIGTYEDLEDQEERTGSYNPPFFLNCIFLFKQ